LDPKKPEHYLHGGLFAGIRLGKSALTALNLNKNYTGKRKK
jgi:hypothetical protein